MLNCSRDIFITLLPKPSEEGRWPAPTKHDEDLAVQVCKCLYEINDEQQPLLQNKIERMKFIAVDFRDCSLAPIDVAALLHFLEIAEEVLYINLSLNELGDLGASEVKTSFFNKERKLKSLDLTWNNLTDNAAKDFASALKEARKGFFGCYSVCETMKDTKEGYFIM